MNRALILIFGAAAVLFSVGCTTTHHIAQADIVQRAPAVATGICANKYKNGRLLKGDEGDYYFPSGHVMRNPAGTIYYDNHNVFVSRDGTVLYPVGNVLKNHNSAVINYPNGSVLRNQDSEILQPNGEEIDENTFEVRPVYVSSFSEYEQQYTLSVFADEDRHKFVLAYSYLNINYKLTIHGDGQANLSCTE